MTLFFAVRWRLVQLPVRSGPLGIAIVVTLKVSVTPPILSVRLVVVEKFEDAVCLTVTVSPLLTVPAAEV